MGYVIAVSNEKGGVAKTTTALSLGAVLAEAGQRVLLIDLDPQANLTIALGIEPGAQSVTSSQILLECASIADALIRTDIGGLDLVPSQGSLEAAEEQLPARSHGTTSLRRALEAVSPLPHDIIVLDCPPLLGALTSTALSAADLVVVPTQAEYFSVYALRNMMGLIRRIRRESNPGLGYRILITLMDRRNRAHRDIHGQLRATFGEGVLTTVIEVDTKLRESPIAGLPITRYWPEARGALQYRQLGQELAEYIRQEARQVA